MCDEECHFEIIALKYIANLLAHNWLCIHSSSSFFYYICVSCDLRVGSPKERNIGLRSVLLATSGRVVHRAAQ